MSSTTSLRSARSPRVPVRALVAATAALVAVAGAMAFVGTREDAPARPAPRAVVANRATDPHDDPLVARFGQAESDPANDPLVIRYGGATRERIHDAHDRMKPTRGLVPGPGDLRVPACSHRARPPLEIVTRWG